MKPSPQFYEMLGRFDLDPCADTFAPFRTADTMLSRAQNGLAADWFGRVWLNPPDGQATAVWMQKMRKHGNGIAIVPAKVEARGFFDSVWGHASAILFVRGKTPWNIIDGAHSDAPRSAICLIAYGDANAESLRALDAKIGHFVKLASQKPSTLQQS